MDLAESTILIMSSSGSLVMIISAAVDRSIDRLQAKFGRRVRGRWCGACVAKLRARGGCMLPWHS